MPETMFAEPIPCIVELFGHNKIAGRVSEQSVGGSSFVRVDVPQDGETSAFTKLYGASAIYSITPVSEAIMLMAVHHMRAVPIHQYELPALAQARMPAPFGTDDLDDDEFEELIHE